MSADTRAARNYGPGHPVNCYDIIYRLVEVIPALSRTNAQGIALESESNRLDAFVSFFTWKHRGYPESGDGQPSYVGVLPNKIPRHPRHILVLGLSVHLGIHDAAPAALTPSIIRSSSSSVCESS
ncbi:hypothetical protein EVAR_11343_1 [Eumeta japonica]|uniref:Uncharacterized protein n=1 Tax=Eumeta variegata TaxID=151549 RepID=A0A4C1U0R6_EUMVA|nr:hypothetical protein EVAR_11343_1 [Eumeta japonica]